MSKRFAGEEVSRPNEDGNHATVLALFKRLDDP